MNQARESGPWHCLSKNKNVISIFSIHRQNVPATRAERIENIQKRFHDEWLLIRVFDFDHKRTLALMGKLIAHRKKREELYPLERKHLKTLTLGKHFIFHQLFDSCRFHRDIHHGNSYRSSHASRCH